MSLVTHPGAPQAGCGAEGGVTGSIWRIRNSPSDYAVDEWSSGNAAEPRLSLGLDRRETVVLLTQFAQKEQPNEHEVSTDLRVCNRIVELHRRRLC